jgi:hypothetical protein
MSGEDFRASCWSWRPIHALCEELNTEKSLGLDLHGWGYNDGCGLHSQTACNLLADAIEERLNTTKLEKFYVEFAGSVCRVNEQGKFLKEGETGGMPAHCTDREHMLEFVAFLRECGGSFEIW